MNEVKSLARLTGRRHSGWRNPGNRSEGFRVTADLRIHPVCIARIEKVFKFEGVDAVLRAHAIESFFDGSPLSDGLAG